TGVHVLIVILYIGVGMVEHIVLNLPVVDVPGQDIDAAAHELVDPFFVGIGTVVAVVHHVHAHPGHAHSHGDGQKQIGPDRKGQGQYQEIGGQKQGEHHH